jgi:hypothetical protein
MATASAARVRNFAAWIAFALFGCGRQEGSTPLLSATPIVDDAATLHDAGEAEAATAPYTNSDPPAAPPISCTKSPSWAGSFDLGETSAAPSVRAIDERRVLIVWRDLDLQWNALVFDVISGSTESHTKLDVGYGDVRVAPLGGGAFVATLSDGTLRIFSGVRWSRPLPYRAVRRASDGRFLLFAPGRDAWFDGKTGVVTEIENPFGNSDDTPLSGGRILAVQLDTKSSVAVHDGTHWSPISTSTSTRVVQAGDDVIAVIDASATPHTPAAIYTQHFDASRAADGFGAPELLSVTPEGPAVTYPYRYKSQPAASFFTVDDTVHFIGGVATCDTCRAVVLDRTLGKDGWSAPVEIPLGAGSIADVYVDQFAGWPVVTDVTKNRRIARTAKGWTPPLGLGVPANTMLVGVQPDGVYADAAEQTIDGKVTTQWIGYAATADTSMRWMELAPPLLAGRRASVYQPRYFDIRADVAGGIVAAGDDTTALAIARIDKTPALTMLRVLDGARLNAFVSTPHVVMIASTSLVYEGSSTLRVDSWNDRGEGLPLNIGIAAVEATAVAPLRCGGVVAYVQQGGKNLKVELLSGE